ncbi:DUF4870 domain-containing protein [Pedobacter sp. PAMC26386]|nr:DUF4870 domain-containing protein [Pedobacter sp. PAMC26386]
MSNKTLSILSYITIIGWVIAYIKHKEAVPHSSLVRYHLKQGFGMFLLAIAVNIVLTILVSIIPSLSGLAFVGFALFILNILGIVNAANQEEKPVPLVGKLFEDKFDFIA